MNWGTATVFFVAAAILEQIGVAILRSVFDRRRRIRDGAGGTQDIAFFGLIIGWLLIIGAIVCGVGWFLNR